MPKLEMIARGSWFMMCRVVPDSFTHGTSEQRVRWFKRGLQSGDVKSCDTFRANQL